MLLFSLLSFTLTVYAQSGMTDDQIVDYIVREQARGTSRAQIVTHLMQNGVKIEQIRSIQKKMQKTDAARRTYYEQFTGKHWGDSRNYTLSLDTGFLGYDTCVKLICEAARRADALA